MRKQNESILQMHCVGYFYALFPAPYGMLFMNYNNPKSAKHGATLKRMGLVSGVADLTLLTPSGAVFFEIKYGAGKQTENQKRWQKMVENIGYKYYTIRSVQQFLEIVKNEFKDHPILSRTPV